jgi:hypothetical protein
MMMLDLREGQVRFGVPGERVLTNPLREVSGMGGGLPGRNGGVSG